MQAKDLRAWENALEAAELNPITANLPEAAPLGATFEEDSPDGVHRRWLRVSIVSGNTGARWAYWAKKESFAVVADVIFNGEAAHFVGMLGVPYTGKIPGVVTMAWVLVVPKAEGTNVRVLMDEPQGVRYERSREVYDVETQKTTKLP